MHRERYTYSQAVKAGNLIFVSGQLPINAADGTMPAEIKEQTAQSIENVKAILQSLALRSTMW